jgi:hypothetical protein
VEEETPPNWEEILPNMSKTTLEQRQAIGTITPLISLEPTGIGCMVEEEIPPQMEDHYKNFVIAKDEDPGINWDECWNEDDTEEHSHLAPNSCRLTKDHPVLIFKIPKDLAEQQHNQHTLSKRLDVLFGSFSSEPAKIRCSTCYQPFAFKVRQDGSSGSPHV